MYLHVMDPPCPDFLLLTACGMKLDSPDVQSQNLPEGMLYRICFCNKEARLLVQLATDSGVAELIGSDTIKQNPNSLTQLNIDFDFSNRLIEIHINGAKVQSLGFTGAPKFPTESVYLSDDEGLFSIQHFVVSEKTRWDSRPWKLPTGCACRGWNQGWRLLRRFTGSDHWCDRRGKW